MKTLLLAGANLGDRKANLEIARKKIINLGEITRQSAIYESEPWGFTHDQWFLNQAIMLETTCAPVYLMQELLRIESEMGRSRGSSGYEARIIDLDILLFGDLVMHEDSLTLPHPRMHLRNFVLIPAAEICPDWTHPVLKKKIHELLKDCDDKLVVRKFTGK